MIQCLTVLIQPADPDTLQDEHQMLLDRVTDLPDLKELRESLGYHGAGELSQPQNMAAGNEATEASFEHLLQCKQSLASVRLDLAALVDLWGTQ